MSRVAVTSCLPAMVVDRSIIELLWPEDGTVSSLANVRSCGCSLQQVSEIRDMTEMNWAIYPFNPSALNTAVKDNKTHEVERNCSIPLEISITRNEEDSIVRTSLSFC